jgi:thioredoxin reductase
MFAEADTLPRMTTPDDRTEHVPGQLELSTQGITVARGFVGGPLVPVSREELAQQMEALDVQLLAHRIEAVDEVKKKATSATDAGLALDNAVHVARGLGATWQQIADATGMQRQSAWKRWSTGAYPGGPDEVAP